MATTNSVKGWSGVLMTEDSSSHRPTKRIHVYSETSRGAGLKFVCVFGHDGEEMVPAGRRLVKFGGSVPIPVLCQNSALLK